MSTRYQFNRLEIAGSFGDLGVILPIAIGMIMVNGLNPSGLFLSIGLFYIFAGMYYGVIVSVQPMKVISAYALATAISPSEIAASTLLVSIILLILGLTGTISYISKQVPRSVIRGVQVATGTLLMTEGVRFILGTSKYQISQHAAEPFLTIQNFLTVPIGIFIGISCTILTLLFIDNKKFPAGILIIAVGASIGLLFGTHQGFEQIQLGINLPNILPYDFPSHIDFSFALLVLVLPQMPMTVGNAVIANADLSKQYFGEKSAKVTPKALCITMGLANFMSFLLGGMPLCHGAGGLASHFRFGARTAGSNIIIGSLFIALAVFLGVHALTILHLIPFSVLGVLLFFAGSQLAMTVTDVKAQKDFFVIFTMLGITLGTNLAIAFGVGLILSYVLKSKRLNV